MATLTICMHGDCYVVGVLDINRSGLNHSQEYIMQFPIENAVAAVAAIMTHKPP